MANYTPSTEEGKCVFCEIIKGRITTPGIFWEDKEFLAFLSTWPNTEGFTVLVPKKHYPSDVLAMPDKELKRIIIAAKTVSNIINYFLHESALGRITCTD